MLNVTINAICCGVACAAIEDLSYQKTASVMNKPNSSTARKTSHPKRPSLYGNRAEARENAEGCSILNGLEPRSARPKITWRIAWGAPLMALAAALLVAGLNDGFRHLPQVGSSDSPMPQQAAAQVAASVPQPQVAVTAPEPIATPEVATIISEPPKDEAERNVASIAPQPGGPESHPKETPAADEAPNVAVATAAVTPVVLAAPKAIGNISGESAEATQAATREQPAAKKNRPMVATTTSVQTGTKTAGKDKDVDLIAALLTHVSSTSKTPATEASKKAAGGSTVSRTAATSSTAKREKKTGGNRDIVTQAPGESTESLVNRCRALGFFEGELCRLRVCSGMWGKDPACPSSTPDSSN